ncbi:MAG: peptidoglycan bridge formation glycyltransferase FemA/FemB family protein [Chloroflexi bacterium]|nr:peptidoglycan bridge formation glycyltransferase FemA/FemB family protein [Chloroflexota bacterium]
MAQLLVRALPLGMWFAYLPRGPLVADADIPDAIGALRDALRGMRCVGLLCDPEIPDDPVTRDALRSGGARLSPVHVQPSRTLLFDLDRTPEELLAGMRKKTRQYVHKAERGGVITEETADLERFQRVLERVAARDRFGIHDRAYFARLRELFGERAHFQMARVGNEDVGALLVIRIGDRAWELYGGWSGTHTEERPFYLLKWRSLLAMKRLGVVRYDMWGLAEGDASLAGVEQFKLGFGGDVVTWVGAIEAPVSAALYPIWQIAGRRRLARSA